MVINFKKVKIILWFIVVILTALSFPMQVYTGNPYPSVVPYGLIAFIFSLTFISYRKLGLPRHSLLPQNYIGLVVSVYIFMVIAHTLLQIVLGLISFYEGTSSFMIYLLPVLFYCYFRKLASEEEIRIVMVTMVIASLIIGLYFGYDSYIKLSLHQVSDYATKAFEYSKLRAGDQNAGEMNDARIAIGYRSFGLLESHSVSGAWVVIGAIALLSLIKKNRRILRLLVVFVFAVLLLLGLNFTAIIAYFIVIFLFEFEGMSIFRMRFSIRLLVNIAVGVSLLLVLKMIPSLIVGDVMAEFITNNLLGQKELALGSAGGQHTSMIGIILNNFTGYFLHILELPHSVLLGDGFSSFGMAKGGDIGFIETMTKFGLPFFIIVVYGLLSLMRRALKKIKILNASGDVDTNNNAGMLQFSVSFTLVIFISELHYSIWAAKSVLPFLFFAIALYDRYGYTR